jgi:hypothetical protein
MSHLHQAQPRLDALGKKAGGQTSAMLGNDRAHQWIAYPACERSGLPRFALPFRLRSERVIAIGGETAFKHCLVEF